MTLRETISEIVLPPVFGEDRIRRFYAHQAADAILAAIRAHLATDEAVERADVAYFNAVQCNMTGVEC